MGGPSDATKPGTLEITQVRSAIGAQENQRQTLRSLGLHRMHGTVTKPDRPEVRGMVAKVAHLVEVRYAGTDHPVGVEPGQEPKGKGQPPAGSSVADDEAADLREAEQEAIDAAGQATPGEVVQDVAGEQAPDSEEPT